MEKFIGIIPARYASSRFPGKPLAKIGEMTMIERVWRQARKALDHAVVATDDLRIYEAVKAFGGDVVMTGEHHRSGTDRCYEAYCNLGSDASVRLKKSNNASQTRKHKSPLLSAALTRLRDSKHWPTTQSRK